MSYTNRGYRAYHNFPNPLREYGNGKVWYDRDAGIDNLSELAGILGLKSVTIIPFGYNNPSVESNSGRPSPNYILALNYCNLSFEIDEMFEGIQVKYFQQTAGETVEKRIFYKQGEDHIINTAWNIAETTQISFVKDAYKKSVREGEVEICDIIGCARMYEPEDSDTWQYKTEPNLIKTIPNNNETTHNKPFNTTNPNFAFYAIPNFLINDKPLAAYGLTQTQIPYTGDADSKGYYKWDNNVRYSSKMSLKENMENWNYTYVPVPFFDNLTQSYSPKKSYKTKNCFEDKNFGTWLIIENNNTSNDVRYVPKSQLVSLDKIEETLKIVKNDINISNRSYVNYVRSYSSTHPEWINQGYVIKYNGVFTPKLVEGDHPYDTFSLTGDLVRYEYIFSAERKSLDFIHLWGDNLDLNETNLFSQVDEEIYGIGVKKNLPSIVRYAVSPDNLYNYVNLEEDDDEEEDEQYNVPTYNSYWDFPKGLNTTSLKVESNAEYCYSSPLAWRGKWNETSYKQDVSVLINLNANEAIWSCENEDDNYFGNFIVGQSIFLKVPMYEWLFTSDKQKYNNDFFTESGIRYENGTRYLKPQSTPPDPQQYTSCYGLKTNYLFFTPSTDITKESKPVFEGAWRTYYDTEEKGMQLDGNNEEEKEFSIGTFTYSTAIKAHGFYTSISREEFPFPYDNSEYVSGALKVLQISSEDYITIPKSASHTVTPNLQLNKTWEETWEDENDLDNNGNPKIKTRTTSSTLTWNTKPYYQIYEGEEDVVSPTSKSKYSFTYGIMGSDNPASDECFLGIETWTGKNYSNGWTGLDFSLELPTSTTAPKRSALIGSMKEPVWFEFNTNTKHYDLKSIYSDITYELPIFIDLSINFYVPPTTNVIKDFTLEFSSKEKEYEVKINNTTIGYIKTANESMTFLDVNKVDVGFEIYCSLYSYVDIPLFTGGQSIDTPQGHCDGAIKLTVADDITSIFGSINSKQVSSILKPGYTGQITIYTDMWSEGDRAWQGCVFLQKINDTWYLYGWEWDDDGAYSTDNEWTDWNINGLYVRTYEQLT